MKRFKRTVMAALALVLALMVMAGCSNNNGEKQSSGSDNNGNSVINENSGNTETSDKFDTSKEIGVVSREEGSGTRGAFVELFGIEQKNDAGEKIDYTTQKAVVTDSTAVMMTTVAGDFYSIGYISLGSLNETVKAIDIDGAAASAENVENGSYKVVRPFNIATKDDIGEAAQDFIDFIMSADGQQVITNSGYIAVSDAPEYTGSVASGKIVVSGSSSVTPVMEKLKEAYIERNPGVTIEVQQSDSSTGISDAIGGISDIGMASRELKDSELEQGLTSTTIAMDGIAVIVNNDNPLDNLTSGQVKDIFMGEATLWSEVIG